MIRTLTAFAFSFCLVHSSQAQEIERNSDITHGTVQMTLRVGQTNQVEVLEAFGAPNITTVDGQGQEVWSYHRHATVSESDSESGGFSILFGVAGSGVGGGVGGGKSVARTGFEQSSRSMILIIKFNDQKIVSDFRSRYSSF